MQQHAAGEYEVRLCVEEAGLIVTRTMAPTITCNITLTSPVIRKQLIAAVSAGMMVSLCL